MTLEISEKWLTAASVRTHYLEAGFGNPVVLLHGGASDSRDWVPMIHALADGWHLLAPDIIGYGRTDSPVSSYTVADFTNHIEDFLTATCKAPAVLIGHSLGGRIALELAWRRPESISKVVLFDTVGFGRVAAIGGVYLWTLELIRRAFGQTLPHPDFRLEGEDKHMLCLDKLPAITTPVLLAWGKYDPYYPVSYARKAARLLPHCRLVIVPACRHAPQKERPEPVFRLVAEFLKEE